MQTSLDYVGDILSLQQTYAPGEKEIRKMTDVNTLIESALQMQTATLDKRGIAVTRDLQQDLRQIMVDRNRMVQVLVNLIKNACEAIDARPKARATGKIHVKSYSESGRTFVEITDSGIGIDPDHIGEILNPDKSRKGSTGLGLYYCKMFMQNNSGHLSISSPGIDQGATVKIVFNNRL